MTYLKNFSLRNERQSFTQFTLCRKCYLWLFMNAFDDWGRRGRDRMFVGFTTTYVISAYHH